MKASDLFLRCLEAQGVDTIFGVPGEENADIMISLLNSPIKFITCRHEQTASFMADMHGRLTGKPGVCLATLGPGATNLITGVANANMDHAPLIALVGQASTKRLHKESHQNMDSVAMYRPVTKWATTVRDASVIPEIIEKAFKVATEEKPGAVMIELPEDIAKIDVDAAPLEVKHKDIECGAASHHISRAIKLIETAKNPILLLGAGCNRESCQKPLKEFTDKTGCYFATTFMGKGTITSQHPHSLYCVGLGVKDIAIEAFDKADLIICVGYDMVEWHPERWNADHPKKILHIDTLPAEVDKNYLPEVELVGDIASTLEQINSHLTKAHLKNNIEFADLRAQFETELNKHNQDSHFPMRPQRILSDLRSILREDDIVISDVGAHKMWVARHYPAYASKSCFIYNGFCSMGGSLPAATEAKRLMPEKRIVAICGDGGFMMSIQAIVTAKQLNLPIVLLLWQDNFYGLIKWKQEAAFHTYSHVDLENPDLSKLAEAFGCKSIAVKKADELLPALNQAFKEEKLPTVIVVPVDYTENMRLNQHLAELISH